MKPKAVLGPRNLRQLANTLASVSMRVAIDTAGTQAGAYPSPGPGPRTSHVMAWSVVAESIVPPSLSQRATRSCSASTTCIISLSLQTPRVGS